MKEQFTGEAEMANNACEEAPHWQRGKRTVGPDETVTAVGRQQLPSLEGLRRDVGSPTLVAGRESHRVWRET